MSLEIELGPLRGAASPEVARAAKEESMQPRRFIALSAVLAAATAMPDSLRAQAPVVGAGECLYLVGAPPGAPAALTEETSSGWSIPVCEEVVGEVNINRDGANMVQAWIVPPPPPTPVAGTRALCILSGHIGHGFQIATGSADVIPAAVTVSGSLKGLLDSYGGSCMDVNMAVRVAVRLVEVPATGPPVLLDERIILDEYNSMDNEFPIESSFAARLSAHVRAGQAYRAELQVRVRSSGDIVTNDFGSPGSGKMVSYDTIEVCLQESESGGMTATAEADLERDLYDGRLMPGLWLPVASGGRYEDAHALVTTRIAQTTATGAPGVNGRVAVMRMSMADDAAARGDFQTAARLLSQALRALTTP